MTPIWAHLTSPTIHISVEFDYHQQHESRRHEHVRDDGDWDW